MIVNDNDWNNVDYSTHNQRYRIAGSAIETIQKGRLMFGIHLQNAADQLGFKFRKIKNSCFITNGDGGVLLKADLVN